MFYLVLMTCVWAFSFSLIGVYLAGQVDAYFSVLIRVALAGLIFLPFIRKVQPRLAISLMTIGAVQLGCMYLFYFNSFKLLSVPEVLLFTILTPVYVTLICDIMRGYFNVRFLISAVIAVLGAFIIRYNNIGSDILTGFLIVQGANFCFALGQVSYKILLERNETNLPQRALFGYFYLGALIVVSISWLLLGNAEKLPTTSLQWGILVYLGIVASGLGYFLWNKGATMVDAGVLAIMNNALIPAGLIVNLLIWNRDANLPRLALGGAVLLLSLVVHEMWAKKGSPQPA